MLGLFEDGKDINKEKINIKEAIDYLADSWQNVTEETIFNCWKKTGILPSSTNEDVTNATQRQQEIMNDETKNVNEIISELDVTSDSHAALLANALNKYFCELEEEVLTGKLLEDDDIIKLVQDEICEDEIDENDSEEEQMQVSLGDAFKSMQTWVIFFEQQKTDEFNMEDMRIFKKYLKIMRRLELQARKQVPITQFF